MGQSTRIRRILEEDVRLSIATLHQPDRIDHPVRELLRLPPSGRGRRVLICAVHHVHAGGFNYCGGAEKHVRFAVESLLASGAAVTVAYSGTDIYEDLVSHYSSSQLTLQHVGWLNEVLAGDRRITPALLVSRWRWMREQGVETVYFVQQASGRAFRASVLAARLARLRVVCTLRQAPEPQPEASRQRVFGVIPKLQWWRRRQRWQYQLPALCANTLIYNSEAIAQQYEREFGFEPRRRQVVRNGLRCDAAPRDCIGDMRLGFVGRLTQAKGVMPLFDAFERIAPDFPRATLTFYGDGPLRSDLKQRITQQDLIDRVKLPGHVSNKQTIFNSIDLYIHPSLREAMPNSVLEAMAAGIPTIATNVGGTPEVIDDGETGVLVPPNSVSGIADAIRRLANDSELYRRCAINGRRLIASDFDVEVCAARLVKAILG